MSHYLKDGQRWSIQKDGSVLKLDKDEIVQDGQVVRVPMIMQDSKNKEADLPTGHYQHPRQGAMSQADSQTVTDARTKYIERSQNAWRDACPTQQADRGLEASREPHHPTRQPFVAREPAQVGDEETAAYRAYKARLEDGYRHAKSSHPWRA